MPRSCAFELPVKLEEANVSTAVVPPRAIIQAVIMANINEKALVARFSGDVRPTTRTETV